MKISLVTVGPKVDPVSLIEAKRQVRIDASNTVYDAELLDMIKQATALIERMYSISLITQTRQQRQDNFYESFDRYPLDGVASQRYYTRFPVKLLYNPVQSISSVTYTDTNGATQTLVSGTDFSSAGLVTPVVGAQDITMASIYPVNSWPTFKWIPESVKITYVSGFGDDSTYVPAPIKRAILYIVSHFFENRLEEGTTSDRLQFQLNSGVERLMSTYQTFQNSNIYA